MASIVKPVKTALALMPDADMELPYDKRNRRSE